MPSRIAVASCRNFSRREAQARSNGRVDLKIGGRAADGVFNAVLHVDHAGNLGNGIADARTELVEQLRIVEKTFDLDGFGRIGKIVDVVLQNLR